MPRQLSYSVRVCSDEFDKIIMRAKLNFRHLRIVLKNCQLNLTHALPFPHEVEGYDKQRASSAMYNCLFFNLDFAA